MLQNKLRCAAAGWRAIDGLASGCLADATRPTLILSKGAGLLWYMQVEIIALSHNHSPRAAPHLHCNIGSALTRAVLAVDPDLLLSSPPGRRITVRAARNFASGPGLAQRFPLRRFQGINKSSPVRRETTSRRAGPRRPVNNNTVALGREDDVVLAVLTPTNGRSDSHESDSAKHLGLVP